MLLYQPHWNYHPFRSYLLLLSSPFAISSFECVFSSTVLFPLPCPFWHRYAKRKSCLKTEPIACFSYIVVVVKMFTMSTRQIFYILQRRGRRLNVRSTDLALQLSKPLFRVHGLAGWLAGCLFVFCCCSCSVILHVRSQFFVESLICMYPTYDGRELQYLLPWYKLLKRATIYSSHSITCSQLHTSLQSLSFLFLSSVCFASHCCCCYRYRCCCNQFYFHLKLI